ncbi:YihY/virulence factor BrkB family protein [bacterium 1XD8-76]|nr:YihY/virulence factor BrkB family protein [bacterium 1XD8-76]
MNRQKNSSMIKKLYQIFYRFGRQMTIKNISSFAASTAFFLFISLIPILYLVCSILPYVNITQEALRESIDAVLPGVIGMFLNSIIADVYGRSAGGISLAVLVMLWSAGKGMMALMRGLNAVNEVEEEKNYFFVRVVAATYTILLIAALVISMVFSGFGKFILKMLIDSIPGGDMLYSVLGRIRFLYSWIVLTVLFMTIYSYVPGRRQKFLMQLPGAFFTAIIWNGFSLGFSVYLEYFGDFGVYGSLATVVIVLLWLYCMSYIVMVGAHINRYFRPANEYIWEKRLRRNR